jgi:hypothetical protein
MTFIGQLQTLDATSRIANMQSLDAKVRATTDQRLLVEL